jgi:hypothetical protein
MKKTLTFIDSNKLPRVKTAQGEVTEVLNRQLAGAMNVLGMLRGLSPGEEFDAQQGLRCLSRRRGVSRSFRHSNH